jgi:selenide,water dikinase
MSLVDDPRALGAIAAAHALSEVYAAGGRPRSALSVVTLGLSQSGAEVREAVLAGALEVLGLAGAEHAGGRSVDDPEPKFGLAVRLDPERAVPDGGGRPGDVLFLSKPLGTGAIATAARHGTMDPRTLAVAVKLMSTLNAAAGERAIAAGATAITDVTEDGLLGRLHALARASGVRAELDAESVPALAAGAQLLRSGAGVSAPTRRNLASASERFAFFSPTVAEWRRLLLADATTSGGIIAAVAQSGAGSMPGHPIGRLVQGEPGTIAII